MAETKNATQTQSAQGFARQSRSGATVARLMRGEQPDSEDKSSPQHRRTVKKEKFVTPSEFLAGPGHPGPITHGPRRFRGTNKDTVRHMLSDDFLMGRNGAIVVDDSVRGKQLHAKSHLSHLTNVCDVTEEPQPFRTQIHINPSARATEVPYFLHHNADPRSMPQEKAGKRQFKNHGTMHYFLTGADEKGAETGADHPAKTTAAVAARSNKSNKSVDVLNLGKYDPDDLLEVKPRAIQRGPRYFEPMEMPPARRPQIRPMKVSAKEEHDVFGTGFKGKAETVKHSCKARGGAHPSESNNLFGGIFLPKGDAKEAGAQAQAPTSGRRGAKNSGSPNLLRYYDPTLDGPAGPEQKRKSGNRANMESNHDAPTHLTGKAKGAFHDRYSCETPGLLGYA